MHLLVTLHIRSRMIYFSNRTSARTPARFIGVIGWQFSVVRKQQTANNLQKDHLREEIQIRGRTGLEYEYNRAEK
jgi:hypothetical protein